MKQPHEYPRRILVAVTGLSPQVVTESIYALAVQSAQAFVPTEVRLITTAEGAEKARLALLSETPGGFHRLRRDYALPHIRFDEECIHILHDADGQVMDDIRSPEDNLLAADLITAILRELTADPDTALHVSIAGGRKTMGFFLGYALSLFGRPQDRLSHVLVSEPFESSLQFFYPTPGPSVIEPRAGMLRDARDARVTLAEIPFVSLRHGLPDALLTGRESYSGTVAMARLALGPAELVVDVRRGEVIASGRRLKVSATALALLLVFARRRLSGLPPVGAPPKDCPDPQWAAAYLAELRHLAGPVGDIDATEQALHRGMDGDYFSMALSRLRKTLRNELGAAAAPYLVSDGGSRPRRYSLEVAPGSIHIRE